VRGQSPHPLAQPLQGDDDFVDAPKEIDRFILVVSHRSTLLNVRDWLGKQRRAQALTSAIKLIFRISLTSVQRLKFTKCVRIFFRCAQPYLTPKSYLLQACRIERIMTTALTMSDEEKKRRTTFHIPPSMLKVLDELRRDEDDFPTRAEMVRRLIARAGAARAKAKPPKN